MHVHLREGELNPVLFRKCLIDSFLQLETGGPVVGRLHPGAHYEVDGAFVQLHQGGEGFIGPLGGPVQIERVGLCQLCDRFRLMNPYLERQEPSRQQHLRPLGT